MSEITRDSILDFLHYENRLLDDREFEQWLECYHPDAEYWMPSWDVNDELTTDPQSEISLIYYPTRAGMEDRVFRIRTERSAATSIPEPRTGHNLTNLEILERRDQQVDVRYNWISYYFRYNTTDHYFGTTWVTIDFSGEKPQIVKKKVVLKNDYIHHVVDVYML
ncbi:benzoate 1,2-dioxygenase small subunit [Corynebacterium cystitidis]|uniref:Benzoate/toluate 1,2-dioxygenase beta subunit n=1 Tax=Corynebacterium cystitidis DSM 20524 TaxID=1121357 RepID=A0A1H9SR14_9CORY|nr:benzoate 1,2-dioxygenase small subunit [Corynebacterium cystitidis]WJY83140.1 2-halobenzoate 1,2-dioxygenase small subunit [Corynebacterium cystitidis DSM 20524]SER87255.1 benzoate/toluate 1,2-dioxygenase beta subunit [Corynebacterium cystitidis DSM 20524]SNV66695.1 benzoate dioxygenase small subunit [Corynebacterium cystitidis]